LPATDNGLLRVLDVKYVFQQHELSPPLVIGKGTIDTITEATCQVTITNGIITRQGFGTVLLSHVWCWPEASDTDKDLALRGACETVAKAITQQQPSDCLLGLGHTVISLSNQLLKSIPPLARRVCCAPLDNAIHDAAGCLAGCSSFELFTQHGNSPFDATFPGFGAASAIDSMLHPPKTFVDAQMVVGFKTSTKNVTDYCTSHKIRRLKIKIGSGDIGADVNHVIAVCKAMPATDGYIDITLDANGCYESADKLTEFLSMLRQTAPDVAVYVSAIEQPSMSPDSGDRQLWSKIAADTPLLVDETFTQLDDIKHASTCGWNGLAIKSCRGQTLALLGAAWGHARGWKNTVMDLTSPNIAAIHTVLLASRISGVTTAEVNAAQFLRSGYENLPDGLKACILPIDGVLSVPNVTEGLIPTEYRPVLIQRFEDN
jgi:L-alanine-DL-glutamate epimerase-like enolase superfamily enzyme